MTWIPMNLRNRTVFLRIGTTSGGGALVSGSKTGEHGAEYGFGSNITVARRNCAGGPGCTNQVMPTRGIREGKRPTRLDRHSDCRDGAPRAAVSPVDWALDQHR